MRGVFDYSDLVFQLSAVISFAVTVLKTEIYYSVIVNINEA